MINWNTRRIALIEVIIAENSGKTDFTETISRFFKFVAGHTDLS